MRRSVGGHTHTHTLTDTPRLANGHTQPQTHRYMYPQTDINRHTYLQTDRRTHRKTTAQIDGTQTPRQIDTQTHRQTHYNHTHTHMDTQILFSMIGVGFADLARGCVVLLGLCLVSVFRGPGVRGWWARRAGWERLGG